MRIVLIAIAASLALASPSGAELRRVEIKTLGMD
jgi:hypothetical protein